MNLSSKILSILCGALLFSNLHHTVAAQQQSSNICRVGLEYQVSQKNNWGAGRPIVLSVIPGSPAQKAGLQVGDIIEKIDGKPTKNMTETEISQRLRAPQGSNVVVEVNNFSSAMRPCVLQPECQSTNELTERQMAAAFSLYSLEDESERLITYPFDTGTDPQALFTGMVYYSFVPGFIASDLDKKIADIVSSSFNKKGFEYSERDADLLIDTYYTLQENPYYDEKVAQETVLFSNRLDPETQLIQPYPLLEAKADKRAAKYALTFGLRIHDARRAGKLLWSCEATEQLTEEFSVEQYAALAIPMMLMQFPFVRYNQSPIFRIAHHQYNYTGILYKASDIGVVSNVLPGSPAQKAGIRPGDRIIAINGREMADSETLSNTYIDFVKASLKFRDANTSFKNRSGLANCRYWRVDDYNHIARMLKKEKYHSAFAYLFSFRPWISTEVSEQNDIVFDVLSDNVLKQIVVSPIRTNESYVTLE